MSLNILIIEDDPSFVLDIEMMLANSIEFNYTVAKSVPEAKEKIALNPDLIILDLRLKDEGIGILLLDDIKCRSIPFIITTAFNDDDFYSKAKAYNPEAYLVKPFDKLTLLGIIDRLFPNEAQDSIRYTYDGVFVKSKRKYEKVLFSQINYVKAEGNYCSIFTKDGRLTIRNSIKRFYDRIPPNDFLRAHRSYIINIKAISSIDFPNNIVFLNEIEIPIGRNYKNELKNTLLF